MKIKTQVSISLIVFVILAVVILFSYFSSNNQLHEIQKNQQIIGDIEKSSFELYYLENDYLIRGGTLQIERWNAKYAELTGQIQKLTLTDPSEQDVLKDLVKSHKELNTTFSNLVAVTSGLQGKEPTGTSQEIKEFSAGTLAGQTQTLMSRALELSQLVRVKANEVEQRTSLIISSSIAVLMVFVLLNYLIINRSVLKSISTLRKGSERIGSGDLDTKIEIQSNDEMGDLSVTITEMASNLKTVLTSKSALEKEVAERKLAQEQLKEREEKFRQLFTRMPSAVAIYEAVEDGNDFIFRDFNSAAEKIEGIKKDDLIGRRVTQVFPGVKSFGIFAIFQRVWRTGEPEFFPSAVYRDEHDSGTWRESWVYKLTSGEVISIYHDITERKRAEETLIATLKRTREQQEALGTISLSPLLFSGDVQGLLTILTEVSSGVLGVERASVWLFNNNEEELRCMDLYEVLHDRHSYEGILKRHEYENEFDALSTAKYIDAHDSLTDPRTAGYVESYLKPNRITSMLDAVIRVSGQNLGVLCFEHVDRPHHWEIDEIAFACQLADQIAITLLNLDRKRVEEALRESEERYRNVVEDQTEFIFRTVHIFLSMMPIAGISTRNVRNS
jgi:PAS domain S-box-containing protein